MDLQQLLPVLAGLDPARRRQFAASLNIPDEMLAHLERAAVERFGMELTGGPSVEPSGDGDGDEDEDEDAGGAEEGDAQPSVAVVRAAPRARARVRALMSARAYTRARALKHPRAHFSAPSARLPTSQVLSVTQHKMWAFAGTAVFFCALPLVLYIMKERRGISWRGLLQQVLRLPFSD
jgi:hypothetical protein